LTIKNKDDIIKKVLGSLKMDLKPSLFFENYINFNKFLKGGV